MNYRVDEAMEVLRGTPGVLRVLFDRFAQYGESRGKTLGQLLYTFADLAHISQICRAMAFQYRDTVGPWRA